MKIGIIGSGNVGGTLGTRWAQAGHHVVFGSRNPESDAMRQLTGKVLIDATNPLLPNLAGVEYGTTTSGAEQVAGWAHGARVVKAFNTVGFNIMANPAFGAGRAVMFYCGDDAGAKGMVKPLVDDLGFESVDAGPLSQARLLEPLALLWISLALVHGQGREIAFSLLRR
jgi:8-hydroxy-5-deazaflavin:NADPH oxidoreductase